MSEEPLVFNGKKYISSRRASEISGYHIDYLGQLSRSGKMESEMVGRNRYISEESLFTYLHALNLKVAKPKSEDSPSPERGFQEVETQTLARGRFYAPELSLGSRSYYAHAQKTISIEHRFSGPVERIGIIIACGMLAMIFTLPQTRAGLVAFVQTVSSAVSSGAPRVAHFPTVSEKPLQANTYQLRPNIFPLQYKTLVTLDNQYFAVVHAAEKFFVSALIGVREFILRLSDSTLNVLSRFRNKKSDVAVKTVFNPISLSPSPPSSDQNFGTLSEDEIRKIFNEELDRRFTSDAPSQGMVVVPGTGNPTGDIALKDRIQKSFSDEVKVELDESKTAGVIRPLFKQPTDDSYVFVLVPINQ